MSREKNIVAVRHMSFAREGRLIFQRINLNITRGKIIAIMGPSGTGKTTLLRLIGGELKPKSGAIFFDGVDIGKLSRNELFAVRRRLGILFQAGGLFTDLNVFENVAFPLREHTDLEEDMIRDLVLMTLEAVGLRGAWQLQIEQLSGGMARRVALARAVILGPELMLYDEPFTGQDPITRGVLLQLIRKLNDALGMTSVVVSHDVQETASIADYMYLISQGEVIGHGEPRYVLKNENPAVKQFIQGLPDGVVSFHYPAKDYGEDLEEC